MVRLALTRELPSGASELLRDEETAEALHDDEAWAAPAEKSAPPARGHDEGTRAGGTGFGYVEAEEQQQRVHGHLKEGEHGVAPQEEQGAVYERMHE